MDLQLTTNRYGINIQFESGYYWIKKEWTFAWSLVTWRGYHFFDNDYQPVCNYPDLSTLYLMAINYRKGK